MVSQLGAATALAQLLTEGSHLWPCIWTIDPMAARLSGRLATGATMEHLYEYAEVLGGSVRPYPEEPFQGRMMRRHVLTSQWREAVVQVALVIPEPNQGEALINWAEQQRRTFEHREANARFQAQNEARRNSQKS